MDLRGEINSRILQLPELSGRHTSMLFKCSVKNRCGLLVVQIQAHTQSCNKNSLFQQGWQPLKELKGDKTADTAKE